MKSLQFRLQLWHAVVLTLVLAVFGVFVSQLTWRDRLQQIDVQLSRLLPPPPPHFHRPTHRDAGPNDRAPNDRAPNEKGPGERSVATNDRPPPDKLPADSPLNEAGNPSREAGNNGDRVRRDSPWNRFGSREMIVNNMAKEFERRFESEEDPSLYFVIWNQEGQLLQKSAQAPEIEFPGLKRIEGTPVPPRVFRTGPGRRELTQVVWFDMNILVGRSLTTDYAAQQGIHLSLALGGLGVLVVGLVGGWWISRRALVPIEMMTNTAQKISASNLSERIDLHATDDELGTLANVLNATFDRLEEAVVQQTRFTADASHELRTPLAVILANVELALSRSRTPEEYRGTLSTCLRASQRMKALIDNLLILARFDSGDPELQIRPLDLEPLIVECVELLRPLADQRGITIACQVSSLTISADFDRLEQVLTNLISNAIRYNRDNGRIEIAAVKEAEQVLITVADTGIGLPADAIPHVFDRFFRVDKARSRAEGGTGLGLAICRSIVEAHGGVISVRSDGNGSVFEVRLPLPPIANGAEPIKDLKPANESIAEVPPVSLAPQ